jgi:hypothetical protein
MSAGNIMFLPTEVEGISLALMEGMSMGLVPVSVKVGGQAELVTPENGYLIDLETNRKDMIVPFEQLLEQLITNKELLQEMSANSIKTVHEKFSTQQMVKDMKREFCISKASKVSQQPDFTQILLESTRIDSEFIRTQTELIDLWKATQAMKSQLSDRHSAGAPVDQVTVEWDVITLHGVSFRTPVRCGEIFDLALVYIAKAKLT